MITYNQKMFHDFMKALQMLLKQVYFLEEEMKKDKNT